MTPQTLKRNEALYNNIGSIKHPKNKFHLHQEIREKKGKNKDRKVKLRSPYTNQIQKEKHKARRQHNIYVYKNRDKEIPPSIESPELKFDDRVPRISISKPKRIKD